MFRRGLVAMTARILLGVAFVATVLVLVACTGKGNYFNYLLLSFCNWIDIN